jgi:hypothetical protein
MLSAAAVRDLLRLWGTVDPRDLASTIAPFVQAGAIVVRAGRRASAAASSRYYVDFRRLEGVKGQVLVTLPELPETEVVAGTIRGAGLAGVTRARARGATAEQAHRNGFVKLAGSAAQLVAGGGRETLLGAIQSDAAAHGFQRVTDGAPCAFCRMIAGRGLQSKDEGAVSFDAHGHCGCTAEPFYDGSRIRPDNERFAAEWRDATQGLSGTDALNAYRRSLAAPAP